MTTAPDDFAWFRDALKEWRNLGFHRLHEHTGNVWTSGACTESDCGPSIPGSFSEWFQMAYALCAQSLTEDEQAEGMRIPAPFNDAELEMLAARRRIIVAQHVGEKSSIYARLTNPTSYQFFGVTLYVHYEEGNLVVHDLHPVVMQSQLGAPADVLIHRPNRHQSLVFREMALAPAPQPWQRDAYKEFLFVK